MPIAAEEGMEDVELAASLIYRDTFSPATVTFR